MILILQCEECGKGVKRHPSTKALRKRTFCSKACYAKNRTKYSFSNDERPPEYTAWIQMRARCNNPNSTGYHRWGGRGIKVCECWDDYNNFFADMGKGPSPLHSVERKDNDKDYTPENCKWGTREEQLNNTSRNVFITHNGETLTKSQWSRKLSITHNKLNNLLKTKPFEIIFSEKFGLTIN